MDFDVLKVDEYAKKLDVGKSTVFAWKDSGILKPGRHYIQQGKVLRFIWARDLIQEIHGVTIPEEKPEDESEAKETEDVQKDVPTPKPIRRKSQVGINLDY